MRFTISITGIDQAIKNLTAVAKSFGNHTRFLRTVVFSLLKKEFRNVFTTRGYGKWKPLAPSTIREKQSKGFDSRPLIRTGHYQRASAGLHSTRVRRNELEIISLVGYAKYHEFGTSKIPKRAVFELVADKVREQLPGLYRAYQRSQLA